MSDTKTLHCMLLSVWRLHVDVDVFARAVQGFDLSRLAVWELYRGQVALGTRDVLTRSNQVVSGFRSDLVSLLKVTEEQKKKIYILKLLLIVFVYLFHVSFSYLL